MKKIFLFLILITSCIVNVKGTDCLWCYSMPLLSAFDRGCDHCWR